MADTVINLPPIPLSVLDSIATITALRALPSASLEDGQDIVVNGATAVGDGGGGLFAWSELSTANDDGLTIIRPTDTPPLSAGRWVLLGKSEVETYATREELAAAYGANLVGFSHDIEASFGTAGSPPIFSRAYDPATGGQTVFDLPQAPVGELWVFVNGVKQSDFTVVGTTLVFSNPLLAGDMVYAADFAFQEASPTAAIAGTVAAKIGLVVNVEDSPWNAAGDGVTDDTAAFQSALDYVASHFGSGTVIYHGQHKISDLTIPTQVQLMGPTHRVGSLGNNLLNDYSTLPGLRLVAGKTITMQGGAGLVGVRVYRFGMTFPTTSDAAFTGTAITYAGDDCYAVGCQFFGFETAIFSNNVQRPNIVDCEFDNKRAWLIKDCLDVGFLDRCRAWPFTSVATETPANYARSGTAFDFSNIGDWTQATNCFAFGYLRNYHVTDCDDMTFTACQADGVAGTTGTFGFVIEGAALRTVLTGCKVSSQDQGIYIDIPDGPAGIVSIDSARVTTSVTRAIAVNSGDLILTSSHIDDAPLGVVVVSAASRALVLGNRIASPVPVSFIAVNRISRVEDNDFDGFITAAAVTGMGLTQIAAASPLVIPPEEDVVEVSGNANFSVINFGWAKRELTLIFTGTPTLTDSGSVGGLSLAGGTFTAALGRSISFRNNGTSWIETGRKV